MEKGSEQNLENESLWKKWVGSENKLQMRNDLPKSEFETVHSNENGCRVVELPKGRWIMMKITEFDLDGDYICLRRMMRLRCEECQVESLEYVSLQENI